MKLGLSKRITREDLRAKDLPKWIDELLTPLNQFITTIVTALTSRLTFEDNFSSNVLTFEFEHDVILAVNPKGDKLRVTGVLPINCGGAVVQGFSWSPQSNGKIAIKFQFEDSGTHKCKLVFLLGV